MVTSPVRAYPFGLITASTSSDGMMPARLEGVDEGDLGGLRLRAGLDRHLQGGAGGRRLIQRFVSRIRNS